MIPYYHSIRPETLTGDELDQLLELGWYRMHQFGGYDLEHNIYNTKCISIFDAGKLVAAGYFDVGTISGTSILHFFDPEYSRYSLGKYLILLTIDYLKERGYTFYYPGYLVEGLPKMNYKLFLGKEEAQSFDPEAIGWKYFDERILTRQPDDGNQLASY